MFVRLLRGRPTTSPEMSFVGRQAEPAFLPYPAERVEGPLIRESVTQPESFAGWLELLRLLEDSKPPP
jgi:hypothetical protein